MIRIDMRPRQPPVSWEAFVKVAEPFSVALDGYVIGGPRFTPTRLSEVTVDPSVRVKQVEPCPLVNFNHHEGVDRLATRATCAQVLMAIRQGLFSVLRDADGPRAVVLANDCDEDVCLSWYLLRHHATCESAANPLLNRLVMMEDALDATAGAYPFPADLPALRELAWVFEPYRQFRLSGQLDKKDARAYVGVVEDVEGRIGRHLVGRGREIPLDFRYERLGGGRGWTMVCEVGAQARTGLFADGVQAYVAVRAAGEGRWAYVGGRLSPFVRFDCARVMARCNAEEAAGLAPGDVWGGSDVVFGSPRDAASSIPPSRLEAIVNEVVAETLERETP